MCCTHKKQRKQAKKQISVMSVSLYHIIKERLCTVRQQYSLHPVSQSVSSIDYRDKQEDDNWIYQ